MQKILVIEDHHEVRENLEEILQLAGYTSVGAENGKQGIEKALCEYPDLILCDVMMPELDGFGVLHILSKNPQTAGIPFIFLTAKAEKDDFRRGMTLGADDYITKPFDDEQLLETVSMRLQKSQWRKNNAADTAPVAENIDHLISEARAQTAIRQLAEDREARTFRKKDLIFKENEVPRWLYFIESGAVKLFKTSDDGREFITKIAMPGEYVGYLALLHEGNYSESAAVLEDATLQLVPKQAFQQLVHQHRDVNHYFLKMLSQHVAEQEQRLVNLAYNSVRRRVATAVVQLHEQRGGDIHLLREDLAAIAGTAKETLIRTLTDFKNEKLIDIREGGSIAVLRPERLRDLPN